MDPQRWMHLPANEPRSTLKDGKYTYDVTLASNPVRARLAAAALRGKLIHFNREPLAGETERSIVI